MRIIFLILLLSFSTLTWGEEGFTIRSAAFENGGRIPMMYTCNGSDISPPLSWTGVPSNAVSLVLMVTDQDEARGSFYHWLLYNLPVTTQQLVEDQAIPAGTSVGSNTWNVTKYSGPCPPKGITHDYQFNIYALNVRLGLRDGATGDDLTKAMEGHIISQATITGIYSQP